MTTLLAVAHGSRRPHHAATVERLAAAVRRVRPTTPVATAFLELSAPSIPEAVRRLAARGERDVVAVPLLLGSAYHSSVDLPRQLAAAAPDRSGMRIVRADVLGPDALLQAAVERRLREAGARRGEPGAGVVLVAAGSSNPRAIAPVEALARDLEQRGWGPVVPAYSSAAAPRPDQAVAALRSRGTRRVTIATYLLAPGRFSDELAGAGADLVTDPLADAPEVVELVLRRFEAAAGTARLPVAVGA